jgi:hypothetical protein
MPLHSLEQAQFDHVDEHGDLVFSTNGRDFIVKVDDELEHAMLEARQVRSEAGLDTAPNLAQTLPISSIQALIRAGAEPHAVAEKYGLSDALVRRFSTPVQTEKQYAIEQFMMVSAPKDSKAHSLEDLIAGTLAKAHIGMETVTWGATRRGRDPWTITATFDTTRHRVRAEWSWNMHDNTVESLNKAAQILLNEDVINTPDGSQEQDADSAAPTHGTTKPIDAQSSLGYAHAEASSHLPPNITANMYDEGTDDPMSKQSETQERQDTQTGYAPSPAIPTNQETQAQSFVPLTLQQRQAEQAQTQTPDTPSPLPLPGHLSPESPAAGGNDWQQTQIDNTVDGTEPSNRKSADGDQNETHTGKKATKHKPKRSVVPSWDEILFG